MRLHSDGTNPEGQHVVSVRAGGYMVMEQAKGDPPVVPERISGLGPGSPVTTAPAQQAAGAATVAGRQRLGWGHIVAGLRVCRCLRLSPWPPGPRTQPAVRAMWVVRIAGPRVGSHACGCEGAGGGRPQAAG